MLDLLTELEILEIKERRKIIAHHAYRLAEQRGFNGGDAVQDWLEAEKEVNVMFDWLSANNV